MRPRPPRSMRATVERARAAAVCDNNVNGGGRRVRAGAAPQNVEIIYHRRGKMNGIQPLLRMVGVSNNRNYNYRSTLIIGQSVYALGSSRRGAKSARASQHTPPHCRLHNNKNSHSTKYSDTTSSMYAPYHYRQFSFSSNAFFLV